jgi:DNA-binding transcriptional LysR family regulator
MGADHVTPETLSEYPFVGPPQGDDHWPIHWSRTVATHVNQLYLGMQICAQGEMLALLPDVVAQSYPGPGTLHRLPLEIPTAAALYLVRRHPLSSDSLVDMVAGELQAEIGAEQSGRT